nr:hypothetical protein [Cytobacillus eiseniae]
MILFLLLTACRAVPINKVIEEEIPFNVKEVIHKEKVRDGVILLYTTRQKNEKKEEFDAVTVAYLKGNEKDGWENAGHNHWEFGEDERLTVFKNVFYDYDSRGGLENRIPVIYGQIEKSDISLIEVVGKEELKRARIIERESGRYFLKVGEYEFARGVSTNVSNEVYLE